MSTCDAARRRVATVAGEVGFDAADIYAMCGEALALARASREERNGDRPDAALERRWYDSLAAGAPDFGVYADPWYVAEAYACWAVYSRQYIRALDRARVLTSILGPVLDLGCGVGLTTLELCAHVHPARVIGTNLPDTPQYRVAEKFAERYGFELRPDIPTERMEAVFAFEFFEHIYAPVAYLRDLVWTTRPRLLVCANTFGAPSIGHFPHYTIDGVITPGRAVPRRFGHALHGLGYRRTQHRFWNGRPQVWERA